MNTSKILLSLTLASFLSGCAVIISDEPSDRGSRHRSSSDQSYRYESSAQYRTESTLKLDTETHTYKSNKPLDTFYDYQLVKTGASLKNPYPSTNPKAVSLKDMMRDLETYDAIIIGEAHGHVGNHRLQLQVMQALQENGYDVTLSMEQFESDTQAIVDQYMAGEIGESLLKKDARAWPHYSQSYRPLVEFAKLHKMPVIAAESPTSVVRCIGIEGPSVLAKLPADIKAVTATELDLNDSAYKNKFIGFLKSSSHGTSKDSAPTEQELWRYAAQVNRDETMSDHIANHMKASPKRKVVHITGSFHAAGFLGTVERLKKKMPNAKIAVIHPILVDDALAPSFKDSDLKEGNYLALLQPTPKMFANMKNMMAFMKATGKKLENRSCEYSQ